ncbi:hypothetical protein ACP70R_022402 [Stipagrostis hirtigluma subsp. patula]
MAEILVSASTGAMNSLLGKLATLMGEEYSKLKDVRKQAEFLHKELSSMGALLQDLDDMEEGLNNQSKEWRNRVTEMSYDFEDCLDNFMHHLGDPQEGKGFMRRLKTLRARHQIANQIQELKSHVQEASERRNRYKLDECLCRSTKVVIDPRITAIYAETSSLVGIDGPKEHIINMLTKVDDASAQDLRVVSIVGFGGLGKTTLANEVYQKLGESYSFKAFISVSQRPDMINLLKSLFSKVSRQTDDCIYDLQGCIDNLRGYLRDKRVGYRFLPINLASRAGFADVKRYLLVIDDIWDESAWKTIKCAFPDSHCGSIVLTTTRIETVAVTCTGYQRDFVYTMKPLDYYNSRQLFLGRVFGSAKNCPEQYEEPCEKILQKCGGLPLAIITIASLLASQPSSSTGQWNYVLKSLSHNLGSNPTLEGMRHVVNLSYTHLPSYLKTCLLYIGVYPEDHEIEKGDLIRRWIAEGFISGVHGRDAVEVAESYINELVNRSMLIHCVQEKYCGFRFYYKVHDMVLDLILSKSTEKNFLSVVHNLQAIKTRLQCKVRRLSLQVDDTSLVRSAANISLPHARSLTIFGFSLPSLGLFELKFVRVLHIKINSESESLDCTIVGKLFQLRYLLIDKDFKCRLQLPRAISGLQHLETFIISSGGLSFVPQDIVCLPVLSYLELPCIPYPDGIGNFKSLHTLRRFCPDSQSVDNIRALGNLVNLRVLGLFVGRCLATQDTHMDALMSSLQKLINCSLRRLEIVSLNNNFGEHDLWSSLCFSCPRLEELYVCGFWFPRIPVCVGQLLMLSRLEINVQDLNNEDVYILAGLPALVYLVLWVDNNVPDEGVVFSSDMVFKVLGHFKPPYHANAGLVFQAGAMPELETLEINFGEAESMKPHDVKLTGIEHLPNLKRVSIIMGYRDYDESDKQIVQAAIISAFNLHPSRSSIRIDFW